MTTTDCCESTLLTYIDKYLHLEHSISTPFLTLLLLLDIVHSINVGDTWISKRVMMIHGLNSGSSHRFACWERHQKLEGDIATYTFLTQRKEWCPNKVPASLQSTLHNLSSFLGSNGVWTLGHSLSGRLQESLSSNCSATIDIDPYGLQSPKNGGQQMAILEIGLLLAKNRSIGGLLTCVAHHHAITVFDKPWPNHDVPHLEAAI